MNKKLQRWNIIKLNERCYRNITSKKEKRLQMKAPSSALLIGIGSFGSVFLPSCENTNIAITYKLFGF